MSENGEYFPGSPARMILAGSAFARHTSIPHRRHAMQLHSKSIPSPVGRLTLVASAEGLTAVLWENERPDRVSPGGAAARGRSSVLQAAERQLGEYFSGRRRVFSVPLVPSGTPFQRQVWSALSTIPCGETRSYAQIARQIGRPRAVRAVGAAIGRNPLSIFIPCHRVIGADGSLTGFAGGLAIKTRLLELEGVELRLTQAAHPSRRP